MWLAYAGWGLLDVM